MVSNNVDEFGDFQVNVFVESGVQPIIRLNYDSFSEQGFQLRPLNNGIDETGYFNTKFAPVFPHIISYGANVESVLFYFSGMVSSKWAFFARAGLSFS